MVQGFRLPVTMLSSSIGHGYADTPALINKKFKEISKPVALSDLPLTTKAQGWTSPLRDTTPGMNSKTFERYLARDGGKCIHCDEREALSPHHRANRGMGGSKLRDVPSNIVVLCSRANNLLESSGTFAKLGRDLGWKLTAGQVPSETPINIDGEWYLLDDNFGRVKVKGLEGFDID